MALSKGTNSYVNVAEADTYFENRVDADSWEAADNIQKEQALVTATQLLDDMSWTGTAISETQPLAFPRSGSYFDPRLGAFIEFSDIAYPDRIVKATYELALHLLNNEGLLTESGSVTNITVGSIQLQSIKGVSRTPSLVRRLIKPMLINQGSNSWWRAN